MEDVEKKKVVLDFYERTHKYFIEDMYNLENIRVVNPNYGYCGIPQVLTLFAIAELWGKLFNYGKTKNPKNAEGNFYNFVDKFMSDLKDWKKPLYDLIRSGVSHSYYPKGITIFKLKHNSQPPQSLFFKNSRDDTLFNLDYFTQEIKKALDKVKIEIEKDINIEQVYENIQKNRVIDKAASNFLNNYELPIMNENLQIACSEPPKEM